MFSKSCNEVFYQHSCLEMAQEVGNLLASRYPMKGWQDQMQKSTKVSEQLPFNYKMLSQHGAFNFFLSPFAHFIQPTKSLSYHTVVNRSPQNSFVVYLISPTMGCKHTSHRIRINSMTMPPTSNECVCRG